MMPNRLRIRVSDIDAAARFYEQALAGVMRPTNDDRSRSVAIAGGFLLDLSMDQDPSDQELKERLVTPRLECVVDHVDDAARRFIELGSTVKARVARDDGEEGAQYMQVVDPFGYMWAFTLVR